jgi:TPR repeat protein
VLFANYFYYRKAQRIIGRANLLFEEHQTRVAWIKNRAGTSDSAAIMIIFIFMTSLLFLGPKSEEYLDAIGFDLLDTEVSQADSATQRTRTRLQDAALFFKIAESHFNSSPPDYVRASMAYSNAVDNGSLLAAYKLGYMYYTGEGVEQNDLQARDYFELATRAPLAFQPHKLQLATRFLAESYNNLGIIYEAGYGTRKNLKLATRMYNKGAEFGSDNAKRNLRNMHKASAGEKRKTLQKPDYE